MTPIQHTSAPLLTGIAILLLGFAPCSLANEAESGHHNKYTVAGFVGSTHVHGENEFTLGIEAGMSLNERWSMGFTIERAEREKHSTLWMLGIGWHPLTPELRLELGVGRKDPSGKHENVLRAGIGYELELKNHWFMKPYLAADFIDNEDNETVFGLYIGKGF